MVVRVKLKLFSFHIHNCNIMHFFNAFTYSVYFGICVKVRNVALEMVTVSGVKSFQNDCQTANLDLRNFAMNFRWKSGFKIGEWSSRRSTKGPASRCRIRRWCGRLWVVEGRSISLTNDIFFLFLFSAPLKYSILRSAFANFFPVRSSIEHFLTFLLCKIKKPWLYYVILL